MEYSLTSLRNSILSGPSITGYFLPVNAFNNQFKIKFPNSITWPEYMSCATWVKSSYNTDGVIFAEKIGTFKEA